MVAFWSGTGPLPPACCSAPGACCPELPGFAPASFSGCRIRSGAFAASSPPVVDSVFPPALRRFRGVGLFILTLLSALLPRLCRSASLESAGGEFWSPLFLTCPSHQRVCFHITCAQYVLDCRCVFLNFYEFIWLS